ncbi:MAG: hypothetical protein ACRYHQ_01865 [Janthinobacterium lividum]
MDAEQRDLLLSIAFLHLTCGRERRALPLLLLVAANNPDDPDCLRALAHAYTATSRGELALVVLDRLDVGAGEAGTVALLRARALHQAGRLDEARACFAVFSSAAIRTAA